jgi:hypothetical protein
MFGLFKKDYQKIGKETAETVINLLKVCMQEDDRDVLIRKLPPETLEEEYVFSFIYALASTILNCGFEGNKSSREDKGNFIVSFAHHIDLYFGSNLRARVSNLKELRVLSQNPIFQKGTDEGTITGALIYNKLRSSVTTPELEEARKLCMLHNLDMPTAMIMCTLLPVIKNY